MDKIRTLILDDEQHWQLVLRRMAEAHPSIEIAGVYGSPAEAFPSINKGDNDLLLLDVQLAEVRIVGPFNFTQRRLGLKGPKKQAISETHHIDDIYWQLLERHGSSSGINTDHIWTIPHT